MSDDEISKMTCTSVHDCWCEAQHRRMNYQNEFSISFGDSI